MAQAPVSNIDTALPMVDAGAQLHPGGGLSPSVDDFAQIEISGLSAYDRF